MLPFIMDGVRCDTEAVPLIGARDLMKAINHLYKSLGLVEEVRKRITSGTFDGLFTSVDLADGWFQINSCRLYTETILMIEEYLQPAMGLINDAKCMVDSIMAWKIGITHPAMISIVTCLEQAEEALHMVLEEMESWVTSTGKDETCPKCGWKFAYGDNFCSKCGTKVTKEGLPILQ